MSLRDFVVAAGEGTTVGGTGLLTITNASIADTDIAIGQISVAGAAVAKVVSATGAGSATFQLAAVDGTAVNAAFVVSYVILRPSQIGLTSSA